MNDGVDLRPQGPPLGLGPLPGLVQRLEPSFLFVGPAQPPGHELAALTTVAHGLHVLAQAALVAGDLRGLALGERRLLIEAREAQNDEVSLRARG